MQSTSSWETSYFGGYYKVLFDYPEVKVPFDIDIDLPSDTSLSYYTGNKLIAVFLLKVKEYGLKDNLLKGATIEEIKKWGREEKKLVVSQASISNVLTSVISKDAELSNLFVHYKDVIKKTKLSFPVPEKGKGKGDGEEEGEDKDGKGEENSEGKGKGDKESKEERERKAMIQALQKAVELLSGVIPRKTQWLDEEGNIGGDVGKSTVWKLMKGNKKCTYTADELMYSKQLAALLDISFDPQKDKVTGLKTGKLDGKKIAEVPAGNFHIYYTEQENQTTKPFSVCILMDESGSMGGVHHGYNGKGTTQQSLAKVLWKTFTEILPPDKIFVYGHSSKVDGHREVPEIRIYNDKYNHIFEEAICNQGSNGWCNNYDGPVIECVYEKVRTFTDDNIIFIAISDGMPAGSGYGGRDAISELKIVIEKCKRDGFVTVGVGIDLGQIKEIYNYHTIVRNLSKTAKQVSTLINQVVKTEFQE